MVDLYTKIEVLSEFLDCANITLWHFDGEMRLLSSTAPNQELFAMLFAVGDNKDNILEYCRQNKLPGFTSDSASLLWLAAPKYAEKTLTDIYLIGPVFAMEQQLFQAVEDGNIDYVHPKEVYQCIQEISDALVFGSVSYFSSRFKDETGQTPTDYRNYS